MKKCFIVSPIGPEGSDTRKRSDQLFRHIIKPACERNSYEPIRVDHLQTTTEITKDIIDLLRNSELVIADLTDHNPNCFYEIGYRTALDLPIIHLKSESEQIPFDIYAIRTIDYNLSDLDKASETVDKISNMIAKIDVSHKLESNLDADTADNSSEDITPLIEILQDMYKQLFDIHESIDNLSDQVDKIDAKYVASIVSELSPQNNISEKMGAELIMQMLNSNPKQLEQMMRNLDHISKIIPKN